MDAEVPPLRREPDSLDDFDKLEDDARLRDTMEMGDTVPDTKRPPEDDPKLYSQAFVDLERHSYVVEAKEPEKVSLDALEHYTDSEDEVAVPEEDVVEEVRQVEELEEPKVAEVVEEVVQELPVVVHHVDDVREEAKREEVTKREEVKEEIKTQGAKKEDKKMDDDTIIVEQKEVIKEPPPKIDVEVMFCKIGLDTWFHPERLDPKVESLIYWRDPKKSGPVFGGVLVVLLALTYFSLISVVAYVSVFALTGTISFRVYKTIVQAIQKTGDGHPFKEYLESDVSLPQEKVKEVSEVAVAHINAAVAELRRLFLVEDLVDSIKFGVLLWCLTYLGSWFNGMTLIIITWVALFTLPKVYEMNKTQIDKNLEIVRAKLAEITSKVKAAIPIGKKPEVEKKEQ